MCVETGDEGTWAPRHVPSHARNLISCAPDFRWQHSVPLRARTSSDVPYKCPWTVPAAVCNLPHTHHARLRDIPGILDFHSLPRHRQGLSVRWKAHDSNTVLYSKVILINNSHLDKSTCTYGGMDSVWMEPQHIVHSTCIHYSNFSTLLVPTVIQGHQNT